MSDILRRRFLDVSSNSEFIFTKCIFKEMLCVSADSYLYIIFGVLLCFGGFVLTHLSSLCAELS